MSWFCKFGSRGNHLIKNPRTLDCGMNACLACIQEELRTNANGRINCVCNQKHTIEDVNKLAIGKSLINFEENLKNLFDEFVNKLHVDLDDLLGTLQGKLNTVETVFDSIKDEIDLRVESIKCELDNIRTEYYTQANQLKSDVLDKLACFNTQIEPNLRTYADFLKNFQNTSSPIKENIYSCEKYLLEIRKINADYHKIVKSTKFRPSQISIDRGLIGQLSVNYQTNVNLNKLQHSPAKTINMPDYIKIPYYFCEIDQNVAAIIDIKENEIYLLNRNLDVVRRIIIIGEFNFDTPLAMCVDHTGNVFLCDSGNDRILVTDKTFGDVKRVIGRKGSLDGHFNHPRDIFHFKNSLYVLDYYNQCVQIFDVDGAFDRKFRLYNISQLPDDNILSHQAGGIEDYDIIYDPYKLAVAENAIAIIDYRAKIFVYNFNGDLKHIVEQRYINNMCFIGGVLLTHGVNGLIRCYDTMNYTVIFERIVDNLQKESQFLAYFNESLIFGFHENLAVID